MSALTRPSTDCRRNATQNGRQERVAERHDTDWNRTPQRIVRIGVGGLESAVM